MLENVPALGVNFQLGVDPGFLQIFDQLFTVGLQNFVCAHLHKHGRQAAQVGKQRAVTRAGPIGIGAGVGCAHGGEVEQFIRETLEEQRARSECEPSEVAQIVGDAINDSKMPEFELPKESVFTSKDKERDARYYSYDKSGKLIA